MLFLINICLCLNMSFPQSLPLNLLKDTPPFGGSRRGAVEALWGLLSYNPSEPLIFSSGLFLFLFLAFAAIYCLLHKANTLRILFVTLFSYYFYYKSSGLYFFLLAVVTITDFFIGKAIYKSNHSPSPHNGEATPPSGGGGASWWLFLSIFIDLSLLAYFKYTNFFAGMFAPLWTDNFQPWDIFLPVGISFFTFQSLSYTIDIYRQKIKPLNSLLDYAFYVSFFPQLVAGPIVRASHFIPQIRKPLFVSREMFAEGVFLIGTGLFKKAVISDYISSNFIDRVFESPQLYSGLENLLATYGYTLQIYCDFSGYSDMAIGIALLLGFRFPINFRSPYKSTSITDFWRRWHISLSSWLKDYLYIPLGGNRKGKLRQYINLMLTMLLGGLWHGASLNFILWGGLHGIALAIDKVRITLANKISNTFHSHNYQLSIINYQLISPLSWLLTFHFVALCWLFFRNNTFSNSLLMLKTIATNLQPQIFQDWITSYPAVAALIATGYILHFLPASWNEVTKRILLKGGIMLQALFLITIIYIVIQVKSSDIQPFIYFQF